VVTTIHGLSSPQVVPVYRAYNDIGHYVAVSAANRHPDLKYAATIHPGLDMSQFTFVAQPGGYLLFLGRIHPDKGTHLAIDVARRAGLPLIIAGVIEDEAYFRDAVEPHVDGAAVTYRGAAGPAERDALLGGARALLHLISFAEPFGLGVVEALATGTPVIATPLGSMSELVRHGVTGYLVSDAAAAAAAVAKIDDLDRSACREDALTRFSADRMIDEYLALFQTIVGTRPRGPGSVQGVGSVGLFSHAGMHH
jgi:glycosyltransferase involved in cell wall biosynthesis